VKRIIISRTDGIGDVILTLPLAGVLKELNPDNKIIFLGKDYTRDVIEMSENVDEFVSWDDIQKLSKVEQINKFKSLNADSIIHVFPRKEIAKIAVKAGIPMRMGTTNRIYHWRTCNYMIILSRKNSDLHEVQLNLKLLKPFGINHSFSLDDIPKYYGIRPPALLSDNSGSLLSNARFNLIIHPKSKGSSREWGLVNYAHLIELLKGEGFQIFITGTEEEGAEIRKHIELNKFDYVTDITGKLNLKELIGFISAADGMLASSTGPLHIAAVFGKLTIGLYPSIRPMHPGRWAPVGILSSYISKDINCSKCRRKKRCQCLESITPEEVRDRLLSEL
jgi:ADP-heptose:LPS heptosyltransferase